MPEFGKRNGRPVQMPASRGAATTVGEIYRRDPRFHAIRQAAARDDAAESDALPATRDQEAAGRRSSRRRHAAMPWKSVGLVCCALIVIGTGRHSSSSTIDIAKPRLQIREEPERIVLDWAGPVEPPMHDLIATALDRYRTDPRRIVLALNSPGGNVAHGRAVMASIRQMGRLRRVDTRLEAGAICASMCVPIYMQGARRSADPAARFMFHEAKLNPTVARLVDASTSSAGSLRKSFEGAATSVLYKNDLRGTGVSWQWLDRMRNDIVDREVWRTAQQLKEEESGVVVELGAEGPR